MGAVRSFLLALRAAESESHLKCILQSNPERERERGGGRVDMRHDDKKEKCQPPTSSDEAPIY